MVELTLLEIDVDVDSVTAKAHAYAPFARSTGGEDTEGERTEDGPTVEVERSGRSRAKVGLAAALVGLVFLVVAAVLLRRYVTEGDEEEDLETAEVAIE
ncbi:MAG: hypothetical protein V5A62_03300 [Haloarculaceae archaeon]